MLSEPGSPPPSCTQDCTQSS